jgi:hypothetical protein
MVDASEGAPASLVPSKPPPLSTKHAMAGHTSAHRPGRPGHGAHHDCPCGQTPASRADPLLDPLLLEPEPPPLPAPDPPLLVPLPLAPEDDPLSRPEDEPPPPPEDEPTPPSSPVYMKSLPPQLTTPTSKVATTTAAYEAHELTVMRMDGLVMARRSFVWP